MAFGKVTFSYYDWDKEVSTVGIRLPELDAGNLAAYTTAINTLGSALDAVTLGWRWKQQIVAGETLFAGAFPAQAAQRESKWLVKARDNTFGNALSVEIPTANVGLLTGNVGTLDITGGVGLALKDALEAIWVNNGENTVTVHEIKHVGRNL
jgi:hypothetical protein